MTMERNRICIAILALGGQGGGVLADWIQQTARGKGWHAQATSVPGVAQRTGSTVYYVELAPRRSGPRPVLAQMPAPGDVDVVLASELMEAGRAMTRGFCTPERTTLISSTHRIYAISEKMAMADGRADSKPVLDAAEKRAKRFIGFDMEAAATKAGSVISSVMLGALAGSGALPFEPADFEATIRKSGIAVESNLKGFISGLDSARSAPRAEEPMRAPPAVEPTTSHGHALDARIRSSMPREAWSHVRLGVQRILDHQGMSYAELYLERLKTIARADTAPHVLTSETARHLALWMSYDDTIRVADLKTRRDRMSRVRVEVRAETGQIVSITEFMHPRLREICEILPAPVGRVLLNSRVMNRVFSPLFRNGRHVHTTQLRWFLILRLIASLRPFRPWSLRYREEQERITAWLARIENKAVAGDRDLALEITRCQRLIKGYGDTFDRGLRNYHLIMGEIDAARADAARARTLRDLALSDETGAALNAALPEALAA
jgi:indolepyruvate ferredoxin oxidoreductase, beta subunit